MLVTTHLFIPGPTNIPEAVRQAMDKNFRATTKVSATSRPKAKLKLAS